MKTADLFSKEQRIFCQNIAFLRQKHQLNKIQMAKRLRISVKDLTSLEKGEINDNIDVRLVFHITRSFGIEPKDMFKPMFESKEM